MDDRQTEREKRVQNRARELLWKMTGISGAAFGATNAELSRLLDKCVEKKPVSRQTDAIDLRRTR